jgi:hypothetical protein
MLLSQMLRNMTSMLAHWVGGELLTEENGGPVKVDIPMMQKPHIQTRVGLVGCRCRIQVKIPSF